jgi:hypothetical protein
MELHVSNISSSLITYQNEGAIYWPEIENGMPRTPKALLASLPELAETGKPIVTVSEHVILWVLMQTRNGHYLPNDVYIWYYGEKKEPIRLTLDKDGDFEFVMPDGFFGERLGLLI